MQSPIPIELCQSVTQGYTPIVIESTRQRSFKRIALKESPGSAIRQNDGFTSVFCDGSLSKKAKSALAIPRGSIRLGSQTLPKYRFLIAPRLFDLPVDFASGGGLS